MSILHSWEACKSLRVGISQIGWFLENGSMEWEEPWTCVQEHKELLFA